MANVCNTASPLNIDGSASQANLRERAFHMRIAEEFLVRVENALLKPSSVPFDLTSVRSMLDALRQNSYQDASRNEIEGLLDAELSKWQAHLAERDVAIEAYQIRRYCDGLKKPLDGEIYLALARFYRSLPHSQYSQSKFDLTLTRGFSTQVSDLYRSMLMSRDELANTLVGLYSTWDRGSILEFGSREDVAGFERFIEECDALSDLDSLTESRLFERIREFKAELGDRFWLPNVAAAAVECNIVVGNQFNGLIARASANLGERLGSEFDIAGAFQDTSPDSVEYISTALKEVGESQTVDPVVSSFESDDLGFLRSLLRLTSPLGAVADNDELRQEEYCSSADHLSTDQPEFCSMLASLSETGADLGPLEEYADQILLGAHPGLDEFLTDEDMLPDSLGRDALSVMLSLESFIQNELAAGSELTDVTTDQIMKLLSEAEKIGTKLVASDGESTPLSLRRLRIANRLLEVRLRTERSIVRFSRRGFHPAIPNSVNANSDNSILVA